MYEPGNLGACPHCGVTVQFLEPRLRVGGIAQSLQASEVRATADDSPVVTFSVCPACRQAIVSAKRDTTEWLVQPRSAARRPIGDAVPQALREDHLEASLVLAGSPKASAALSRRCLQAMLSLRGYKQRDLKSQLEDAAKELPSHLQPFVDHVRSLGNLALHPSQSKSTLEVLNVEPGEAEWMLELLEGLFDHFYEKPASFAKRSQLLEAKLSNAERVKPAASASD